MPLEQEIDDDNIDISILGVPPALGPGLPFLDSDTGAERGGGYLFLSGFSSLYDGIHGWMTRWMGGWMKKASLKTTTTSFTICNKVLKQNMANKLRKFVGVLKFHIYLGKDIHEYKLLSKCT
jgi:hypothetical protein